MRKINAEKREKLRDNLFYQFIADRDVKLAADKVQEHYNIIFSADERKIIRDFLYQMYSQNITDRKRLAALMRKKTKGNLPNGWYVTKVMIRCAEYFLSLFDEIVFFPPTISLVEQADLKIDNKKSTC